jgi:hypothetical protein
MVGVVLADAVTVGIGVALTVGAVGVEVRVGVSSFM